jgi:hypothetical protein
MLMTHTANYDSKATLANVVDDLINDGGIPREQIFADEETLEVKVLIPRTSAPEVSMLLRRHNPRQLS